MPNPHLILIVCLILAECVAASPPPVSVQREPDPYLEEMQRNSELRTQTCNAKHLKVGMGWPEVVKFCPGLADRRIVTHGVAGEVVMIVYKHYPGPTTVMLENGKVRSVQLMEGY